MDSHWRFLGDRQRAEGTSGLALSDRRTGLGARDLVRLRAVGGWVEEPLAPPAADEAAGAEEADLGRDRLAVVAAEPEERDDEGVRRRVGWCDGRT